jgi:opacity protein-like surface antigen
MKPKFGEGRRNRRGRAALLIGLILTLPVLGVSQKHPEREIGIGVGWVNNVGYYSDVRLLPAIGFLSYRGSLKTVQFEANVYFTIPPVPGVILTANAVVNLIKAGPVDPYITAGLGSVVPYIFPVGNAGAGVRFRLSKKLALSLDYRYWLVFVEDSPGIGILCAQISFRY